jgi:hypothetical protein
MGGAESVNDDCEVNLGDLGGVKLLYEFVVRAGEGKALSVLGANKPSEPPLLGLGRTLGTLIENTDNIERNRDVGGVKNCFEGDEGVEGSEMSCVSTVKLHDNEAVRPTSCRQCVVVGA